MKVDHKMVVLHDFKPIVQNWEEKLQKQTKFLSSSIKKKQQMEKITLYSFHTNLRDRGKTTTLSTTSKTMQEHLKNIYLCINHLTVNKQK